MNNNLKKKKSDKLITKLKRIAKDSFEKGDLEKSLQSLEAASLVLYKYNQYYIDDDIEDILLRISKKIRNNFPFEYDGDKNTVLVYDGFALDVRGVILMYLNALSKNKYKIIYTFNSNRINEIPIITKFCNDNHIIMEPVDLGTTYLQSSINLLSAFKKHKPSKAIFYTTPHDVSGDVTFGVFDGLVDRFLIDLTDHAFWIGKKCNDYFCSSRSMGAYIEHYEKGIEKNRIIKLGVNLMTNMIDDHSGLPFDVTKERYVFSGGDLYKTLGDPNDTFYKIIDHILSAHDDIKYIYAGKGDSSKIMQLVEKYNGRVFFIEERPDFYYLIENCLFYLNTYPMFGGMMMKFSALAGKLPITLKHGSDSDGLLLNQEKTQIEYDTYDELINDVDLLINDNNYLRKREEKLIGSVITEERFINNVRGALENYKTDYEHDYRKYDTKPFRKEYLERFQYYRARLAFCDKKHGKLFANFPISYIISTMIRLVRK